MVRFTGLFLFLYGLLELSYHVLKYGPTLMVAFVMVLVGLLLILLSHVVDFGV